MIEELLNNAYIKVDIDNPKSILKVVVKPASRDLDEKNLQLIIVEVIDLLKTYKPKFYISDQADMEVIFPVELQEWIANVFGQAFAEIDLIKYAYVKPKEFIANLSMEQTIDELNKNILPFQIGYFETVEEATSWILTD